MGPLGMIRPLVRARLVDVSAVQQHCDWGSFAAGDFDGVIIKGTEGATSVDAWYRQHVTGARAAGVLIPCMYHFLTAGSPIADQAKNAIDAAKSEGLTGIAIDLESPPPPWMAPITGSLLTSRAREMAQRVQDAGLRLLGYTYQYYAQALPQDNDLRAFAAMCPLWMAWYPHEKTEPGPFEQPKIPAPWTDWTFWQWSGDHGLPAPGIPQVVDHNCFNGDRSALEAWMTSATPSAPPPPIAA